MTSRWLDALRTGEIWGRTHVPDEAPDVAQLARVEIAEPAGEIVGDPDVICIEHEIFEGDMDGEEGRGEEESQ